LESKLGPVTHLNCDPLNSIGFKDLWLEDKDLRFEDKDKNFRSKDKDKDLLIGPRAQGQGLSSRTTTLGYSEE